jgi:hypothetical protein
LPKALKIIGETFGFLDIFCTFAMYKRGGLDHKINPIYLPLKHNDYEQDMENNSADSRVRHQFPADKGQRSED